MPVLQLKGKTATECYHHTLPRHTLRFDGKLSVLEKGVWRYALARSSGPSFCVGPWGSNLQK